MPPKPKTAAEKAKQRLQIIDVARSLFVTKGVEAVSMREIAKGIGYSATSIYSHFTDKEAILRAICDTDFLALASALNAIMQIQDPVERMLSFGRGYADFALSYPNHYRLMFMTPHNICDPELSEIEQNNAEQDAYAQLRLVVSGVYEAGCFREDLTDIDLIAQTIWAAMHGVCALHITMSHEKWVNWKEIQERLHLMQDVMLRGLLREPS